MKRFIDTSNTVREIVPPSEGGIERFRRRFANNNNDVGFVWLNLSADYGDEGPVNFLHVSCNGVCKIKMGADFFQRVYFYAP